MALYPEDPVVKALEDVFDRFGGKPFGALRDQLDSLFDQRYSEYWERQRGGQERLFSVSTEPVKPSPLRLAFDKAVCEALGVAVSEKELEEVYEVIAKEMIVTRGLQRD